MLEVPLSAFAAAHSDGAVVVDVREPGEYVSGHVPGATLVPMGQLTSRLSELPKDGPIYLICASGNRSLSSASYLLRAGSDAHSALDGPGAWTRPGPPVVSGPPPVPHALPAAPPARRAGAVDVAVFLGLRGVERPVGQQPLGGVVVRVDHDGTLVQRLGARRDRRVLRGLGEDKGRQEDGREYRAHQALAHARDLTASDF
mgnify:CR=1 FL=1